MNIQQLHKKLGDLIAKGHGRKPICVDKSSFKHPLEDDGAVVLNLVSVNGPVFVPLCDDDGGTKWNKDGTESGRLTVVLKGGAA